MNLVIGNTSQLSKYFPDDYVKISSRNIDFDYLKKYKWDSVYLCFAEQKTYDEKIDYESVNCTYTLDVINKVMPISKRVVWYSSADLWNNAKGMYSLGSPTSFHPSKYLLSKYSTTQELRNKKKYPNVTILYPVNFNSSYRSGNFLFAKIFSSVIEKKKAFVKNINFHREIVHTSYIAKQSISLREDAIIGSGRLIHVGDFIHSIYDHFNLNVSEYLESDGDNVFPMYVSNCDGSYKTLYSDTIKDLTNRIVENYLNGK